MSSMEEAMGPGMVLARATSAALYAARPGSGGAGSGGEPPSPPPTDRLLIF